MLARIARVACGLRLRAHGTRRALGSAAAPRSRVSLTDSLATTCGVARSQRSLRAHKARIPLSLPGFRPGRCRGNRDLYAGYVAAVALCAARRAAAARASLRLLRVPTNAASMRTRALPPFRWAVRARPSACAQRHRWTILQRVHSWRAACACFGPCIQLVALAAASWRPHPSPQGWEGGSVLSHLPIGTRKRTHNPSLLHSGRHAKPVVWSPLDAR